MLENSIQAVFRLSENKQSQHELMFSVLIFSVLVVTKENFNIFISASSSSASASEPARLLQPPSFPFLRL